MAMTDEDLKPETWSTRIDEALNAEKDWREKGREVVKIYRAEATASGAAGRGRFNMLFANVSILAPAMYQQPPQADVRRRFSKADPIADEASAVLQGALNASFEVGKIDTEAKRMVQDVLLPGRATIRVRWVPVMQEQPVMGPDGLPIIGEDGQPVIQQVKAWEALEFEHVFWQDFVTEPARRWKDCTWIAFRHYLTKQEMQAEFGDDPEIAKSLKDDTWVRGAFVHSPAENGKGTTEGKHQAATEPRAVVWECWDKTRRSIEWIVPGQIPMRLRRDDDYLDLEGFYPCPEPLLSIGTNDNMVPVPEYEIYKDNAVEVARLTERIDAITERMKVVGLFNGSIEELADVLNSADGTMTGVSGVDMASAMSQNVWMLPLDMLAATAVALFNAREQAKQTVYEVTGISDVLRGASNAGETATAQRIKGNFGTLRIDDRRRGLASTLRELVTIAAEIMASKFSTTTLSLMTGREIAPEVEAFLREEARLMCHVDIETDSTIAADEVAEQEAAGKLIQAIAGVLQTFGPLVQSGVAPPALVIEMLKMILKPFKGSRDVLDIIGQIAQQAEGQQGQPGGQEPPPEQPDPKTQADMAKAQIGVQKAGLELQTAQAKGQVDMIKVQNDGAKAMLERQWLQAAMQ